MTVEQIFIQNEQGAIVDKFSFPDKFYRADQLGKDDTKVYDTAKSYAKLIVENLVGVLDVLETGNEPWGEPGLDAFASWSQGFIDVFREEFGADIETWPIKLATPAGQVSHYPRHYKSSSLEDVQDGSDNLNLLIPEEQRKWFSYVTCHPYSFNEDTYSLTAPPDHPESRFAELFDVCEWVETTSTSRSTKTRIETYLSA